MKVSTIVAAMAVAATTVAAVPTANPEAEAKMALERRQGVISSLTGILTTLQGTVTGLTGESQALVTGLIGNIQGILGTL